MPAQTPTIVATSIGLEMTGRGPDDRRLGPAFAHAAALAGVRGRPPRVCLVATAIGDASERLCLLYSAFGRADWQTSHLALFPQPNLPDIEAHLLRQDVVWINGGSAANLLALWRLHGVDTAMTAAWQAGVVLMGSSAGSLCWFLGGTTDSFGQPLRQLEHGLGLLPYSNCPHYDSEPQRRPTFQGLIDEGRLADGYATDDGAGLVFAGTDLVDCIAEVENASAWQVRRLAGGGVAETRLPTRLLA